MLRSVYRHHHRLLAATIQKRGLSVTPTLFNKKPSDDEEDWEQAHVDRSSVANNAIPQKAAPESVVPNSMLASFNNMFDRGPNVGIEIISKTGFVLSNHVKIEQPLILLNGSAFLWNSPPRAKGHIPMKDWDVETFKIFEIISPRPEIVMFGTGREFAPIPDHIRKYFYNLGIQVDQMNSKHAAATYNVLAEEGRRVAAALLPLDEK